MLTEKVFGRTLNFAGIETTKRFLESPNFPALNTGKLYLSVLHFQVIYRSVWKILIHSVDCNPIDNLYRTELTSIPLSPAERQSPPPLPLPKTLLEGPMFPFLPRNFTLRLGSRWTYLFLG